VSLRFASSRSFPHGINEIQVGPYTIRPIPATNEEEGILKFNDDWIKDQSAANPVQEARFILSWLAVALEARLAYVAAEINSTPSLPANPIQRFLKPLEPPASLSVLLEKIFSLDEKLLRTYFRACELYHLAIQAIDDRPSLSVFLLVSSIECLGNIVEPSSRFQDSYATFIRKFCPKNAVGNVSDDILSRLLGKMYEYRSQYAHGGKDVPIAAILASRRGLSWVKHYVEGKEELAPSIDWFAHIVQASLMSYLEVITVNKPLERKRQRLIDLALSLGTAHFKSKRPIQQGQAVTEEDVELQ
jgi:hypothetical protein